VLKYPQALPHRQHWMGWMKEARRLAILTVHQTKNHQMVLWPYQKTVMNYCLPPEEIGVMRAPGSFGEHGTMMTSGLRSEVISTLRGSLEGISDTGRQQRSDARVAPDQSVQQIWTGTQTEGLNHPTVGTVFQVPDNRKVLWLWCRHGHTGKSSLASYLRRHPKIKACIMSGGKIFFRKEKNNIFL